MKTQFNGFNLAHIDKETGEVLCETSGKVIIEDGRKTEDELKAETYVREHELNFNRKEGFVKLYTDVAYILAKHLSATEFKVAFGLSKFVSYESCILKTGYGCNSHAMNLEEMANALDMDYTRLTRVVRSLINKGVFGIMQTGNCKTEKMNKYYIVNPYIYLNGKNPAKDVVKHFFRHSGWKEILNES